LARTKESDSVGLIFEWTAFTFFLLKRLPGWVLFSGIKLAHLKQTWQ
jgi:hypothetical protein